MKRRFNFTERKKITLDKVSIKLARKDSSESFDAKIDLGEMDLPNEATVYIEAYHYTELRRYCFGTVGDIAKPEDAYLSGLANQENIRFRVLVVDESDTRGLILAMADRIKPSGIIIKHSILPVVFKDLGRQVWKIDYSGDGPVLLLNERIPNIHNLARTDPRFHLYIYPAVIREIFTHIFFIDRLDDLENPPEPWHENWLAFARRFIPEDSLSTLNLYSDNLGEFDQTDMLNILNWTDRLVDEFCSSRNREWLKLISLEEVGW